VLDEADKMVQQGHFQVLAFPDVKPSKQKQQMNM
jgi:hypothetical protein